MCSLPCVPRVCATSGSCSPTPPRASLPCALPGHTHLQLHLFTSDQRPTGRSLSLRAVTYTLSCFKCFSSFYFFLDTSIYSFPGTSCLIAPKAILQEKKKKSFSEDYFISILISLLNNNKETLSEQLTAAQKLR